MRSVDDAVVDPSAVAAATEAGSCETNAWAPEMTIRVQAKTFIVVYRWLLLLLGETLCLSNQTDDEQCERSKRSWMLPKDRKECSRVFAVLVSCSCAVARARRRTSHRFSLAEEEVADHSKKGALNELLASYR